MEYSEDPKNQIQAEFAYRLGMIAKQYRNSRPPAEEDFSVTLDVCILQNLLTTCTELLKAMARHERKAYLTADIDTGLPWGLRREMIKFNTFDGKLTGEVVLKRLRNALSHPTALNLDDHFPSSGYTTIPDGSGTIRRYCFVNSPDTKNNSPKSFDQREKAEREIEKAKDDGIPKDVGVIAHKTDKFCFGLGDEPFARIFKIQLTIEEIHVLVIGLSNHLAQPKEKHWDGVTDARLVA